MKITNKALRIGLIGCGRVAHEHHLPSLKRVSGAEITAVADIDPGKASRLARARGKPKWYASPDELLADPSVEAVAVLTPTPSHHEIGMAALRAGKHVFLEKPLALSRLECDQLVDAARKSGCRTMTCFNLRWHRLIRKAKTFIESGRLGEIKAVMSTYTHCRDTRTAQPWHRKLSLGGGVSYNESVHHFDLWRYLLGKNVEEIFAFHQSSDHYEDETSLISARLEDGILAGSFNTFRTSPASVLEIVGSNGRLCINLYCFDGLSFVPSTAYPGSISHRVKSSLQSLGQCAGVMSAIRRGGLFAETFYYAWDHFVRCVVEGREPECSFDDGRQAVLAALAAVESFSTGRKTRIDGDNRLPN